ncbi:MAG TPA: sugar-binding protein [Planctomycetaceae bacterium]|nr:sugar-binding protein [Planctomycetaceae bacterium]
MSRIRLLTVGLLSLVCTSALRADDRPLAPGVRGLATRAPKGMKIDGDLSEFRDAFCTPVEYFNSNLRNRAAQFFYMWDDEAFYAGLRTLDEKQADNAPDDRLWEGDAVEWYFDTRRGEGFRNTQWAKGAVHCYWTGYKNDKVEPRFCLRPGYLDAIEKIGIEVGAKKTAYGAEVEFKLPWANFPNFKPAQGEVIALDAELCYSDGGPRVFRTFAYGSPLSVQQPASQAKIQLVEKLERAYWKPCGPVMMPIRVDTPWDQPTAAHAYGQIALPPNQLDTVGKIVFRLTDLDGKTLGEFEAAREVFEKEGHFVRATAHWPTDIAPPGGSQVMAIVYDKDGKELTRVAPRLVSVNMAPGY